MSNLENGENVDQIGMRALRARQTSKNRKYVCGPFRESETKQVSSVFERVTVEYHISLFFASCKKRIKRPTSRIYQQL